MTEFEIRLQSIVEDIELADSFTVIAGRDTVIENGRYYFQIASWREDIFTHEMGYGFGGKAYLSPFASDSELIQTVFGLYKGFWEHEARETFKWRKRRIFGPHISTEALWEVARRIDIRETADSE